MIQAIPPQGAAIVGVTCGIATPQGSCESARPPTALANSPRMSVRTVSLFSVSFVARRRAIFLIAER
jgi:hypothetical protein